MLRRVCVLWAAIACGVFAGCGGSGEGTGGGSTTTSATTSSSTTTIPPACGDGTVDDGETCDDGNTADGDGCSSACAVETGFTCTSAPSVCVTECGDGVMAGGEVCDDGNKMDGDGCTADCKVVEAGWTCTGSPSVCETECGDGVVAGTEVCDDGNTTAADGCDDQCAVEDGFTCDMASPTICAAICGDGKVVGTEGCDDNNTTAGDGCDDKCAEENGFTCTGAPSACVTTCGDGIIAGTEACDDGTAAADGDGCSAACAVESGWDCTGEPSMCVTVCSDGIIAGAEACDDGNSASGDGCANDCTAVESGWSCGTSAPSVCVTTCGDGVIAGAEVCDDSNNTSGDGCAQGCGATEPGWTCTGMPSVCMTTCGDSIIAGAENCDDGNTANGDGCSSTCKTQPGYVCSGTPSVCATICGDGITAGAEVCDDFNTASGDGCAGDCKKVETGWTCMGSPSVCVTGCGDGITAGAEACDDGNATDGDGCSSACTVETGYACSGAPSVCSPLCGDGIKLAGEKCDDGNTIDGDCCSSTCQLEPGCEIEPNDTIATANNFAALANGNKIKGLITPTTDFDVFMITVPAGLLGNIVAQTLEIPGGPTCASLAFSTVITIRDQNGVTVGTDTVSGPGNCSLLTVLGLAPGNYYVEVKKGTGGSATFTYQLQVDVSFSVCGNGITELGEQCDDGNMVSGDGCTSLCKLEPRPETEPNNSCAAATVTNTLPPNVLFSGNINPANDSDYYKLVLTNYADVRIETFDSTGPGSCAVIDTKIQFYNSSCVLIGVEDDDGSALAGYCSLLDPTLATNSFMQHVAPGTYYLRVFPYSATATFAYTALVTLPALCGNGIQEGSEQCDGGPGCGPDCLLLPICGNGVRQGTEVCDDGNTNNGDGCSSTCTPEPGWVCTGSPSVCYQPCMAGQTLVQYNATGLPLPIVDNLPAGTVSPINVTQVGQVKRVIMQLDIVHTYDADVDIQLITPMGTVLDVSSDNGSSNDNYTNTIFDDTCPPITGGVPPYNGCFSPEQAFSTVTNQAANGTWTLKVIDDLIGIAGTLNSWSLALCVQ